MVSTRISLAAVFLACACARESGEERFAGRSMGTTYVVKVAELPAGVDVRSLAERIDRTIQSVDEHMSTYDPRSEVSRFNASRSLDWFPVSTGTRDVVAEAQRVSRLTDGAFDVTVGPLVELWGFGRTPGAGVVPVERELARARARVGHTLLETRASPPALRKRVPDLEVDLSAIAKGYAVDRVARVLEDAGIRHFLVEIGGELRARGQNAFGARWRVGIEEPSGEARTLRRVVELADCAIATSGDYRDFFEAEGRRYAHVIDPRTGRPPEHGVASATVLAGTALEADALATALMVLRPESGLELAAEQGVTVHLLVRSGDGFVELGALLDEEVVVQ